NGLNDLPQSFVLVCLRTHAHGDKEGDKKHSHDTQNSQEDDKELSLPFFKSVHALVDSSHGFLEFHSSSSDFDAACFTVLPFFDFSIPSSGQCAVASSA